MTLFCVSFVYQHDGRRRKFKFSGKTAEEMESKEPEAGDFSFDCICIYWFHHTLYQKANF